MTVEILQLSFRLMTEKTFNHSMDASLLISDVKAIIESDSEIAPENQRLIFKGQILKDEHTLKSYGVESGSTIHVVGRTPRDPSMESETRSEETENQTGTERQEGTQRSYGIPMGIYMSPIYATISVSSSGDPTIPEGTMEQVASNFFSGVMNSFINSFNNQTTTTVNTPSPRQLNTVEDELVRELEKSTNTMAKVTRSVKTLNNTRIYQTSNPFETNSEETRENEDSRTNTENVNEKNNSIKENEENKQCTINSNENDEEEDEEEEEERTGKVFLIDPESLSSKLPWDSLKKLEQVLSEESEGSMSSTSNSEVNTPMSQRSQNKEVSIRTPYTCKGEVSNNETPKREDEKNNLNNFVKENQSTEVLKQENENGNENEEDRKTEKGVLEEFMTRYHKFNNQLQQTMMDYNQGERSIQLDRFRRVSYAMSIKTGIDTALSALFIWLQTQMVSPERARAFAVYMGWSPNTQTNNQTTTEETQNNETSTYNRTENISNKKNENENENNNLNTESDPYPNTPKNTYKKEEEENEKNNTYNHQSNESNEEMEVDENHQETQNNRMSQTELLTRYKSNPEFSNSMEKVRKTKLSDSYHNS